MSWESLKNVKIVNKNETVLCVIHIYYDVILRG